VLWSLWWLGKSSENIAPYRKLGINDVVDSASRTRFKKARVIMKFLRSHSGKLESDIRSMKYDVLMETLEAAYLNVFLQWYGTADVATEMLDRRISGSMSYLTFYNHIREKATHVDNIIAV
jgi:hypothetical protein